jgi:hypothetical protein
LDDPLLISIFQQSKVALSTQLERRPNLEDKNFKQSLLCAAVSWPAGLQLLLQHISSAPGATRRLPSPLDTAIWLGNLESIEILLRYSFNLTPQIWKRVVDSGNISMIRMIIGELERRFQSSPSLRIGYMRATTRFDNTSKTFDTLYHTDGLTCELADCLYEAGFVKIDAVPVGVSYYGGTALLWQCHNIPFASNLFEKLRLIDWFILKGASFGPTEPRPKLNLIHLLAVGLGQYFYKFSTQNLKDVTNQIKESVCLKELTQEHFDDCRCACSAHGCENLTLLCKDFTSRDSDPYTHPSPWQICQCLIKLGFNLEQDNTRRTLLRVLTFTELELTHTCHEVQALTIEAKHMIHDEITYIQDQEQEDIQLLENLLITFEEAWINHQGTFLDFLEEIWPVKMAEVRKEKEAKLPPLEEELCNIINLGVVLEPFGPKELRSTDLGPEYGTLEWAEWYMSKVLDGTFVNYPPPTWGHEWTAIDRTGEDL